MRDIMKDHSLKYMLENKNSYRKLPCDEELNVSFYSNNIKPVEKTEFYKRVIVQRLYIKS